MNLESKKAVVTEIKERFERSKSAIVVNYRGLDVAQVTELRAKFREANVEYKVYKNSLVRIAIQDTEYSTLDPDLVGPNAIAFGIEDAVVPAKIIKDFAKTNPKLELKSGVVEGVYYDIAKIMELADLPSKEVLIGRFMGSIKAPISNFAYLLSNLIEEKEKEAPAGETAEEAATGEAAPASESAEAAAPEQTEAAPADDEPAKEEPAAEEAAEKTEEPTA